METVKSTDQDLRRRFVVCIQVCMYMWSDSMVDFMVSLAKSRFAS